MEDIVAVVDGCPDLKERVQSAPADVRSYLADKFQKLLSNDHFVENVQGHVLDRANAEIRAARVLALLQALSVCASDERKG